MLLHSMIYWSSHFWWLFFIHNTQALGFDVQNYYMHKYYKDLFECNEQIYVSYVIIIILIYYLFLKRDLNYYSVINLDYNFYSINMASIYMLKFTEKILQKSSMDIVCFSLFRYLLENRLKTFSKKIAQDLSLIVYF